MLFRSGAGVKSANRDEQRYAQGLCDCIVGWGHWVYETNRYFGKDVEDVKAFGWVFLQPKEKEAGDGDGDGEVA